MYGEQQNSENPIFSEVYPGSEAYNDITHNVDGISRLLSIGGKNDDNLSTLERETRNNIRRVVFKF